MTKAQRTPKTLQLDTVEDVTRTDDGVTCTLRCRWTHGQVQTVHMTLTTTSARTLAELLTGHHIADGHGLTAPPSPVLTDAAAPTAVNAHATPSDPGHDRPEPDDHSQLLAEILDVAAERLGNRLAARAWLRGCLKASPTLRREHVRELDQIPLHVLRGLLTTAQRLPQRGDRP
jgi:hypothetical protein